MNELTDWFDPQINPEHHGVYQRKLPEGNGEAIVYSLWTGQEWGRNAMTPEEAAKVDGPSLNQHRPWRGLLGTIVGWTMSDGVELPIYESPYGAAE